METWKIPFSQVKVLKKTRFTKCSLCQRLRDSIAKAARGGTPCGKRNLKKAAHYYFVFRDRREYRRKRELAILKPTEYMSIVIDGAHQKAFTLPHLSVSVKQIRRHGLKVQLIGLLHHGIVDQLNLHLMTDEHENDSNHIVDVFHRFINEKNSQESLPKILFLQLENCVWENKNELFLSYMERLVIWGVFESMEISFLHIVHTHTDIYQTFISTAETLRRSDDPTFADMRRVLGTCYSSATRVYDLNSVVSWSGLCHSTKCKDTIKSITKSRCFKYRGSRITTCQYATQILLLTTNGSEFS